MTRIGLIFQPRTPAAVELTHQAERWLEERGSETWSLSAFDLAKIERELATTDLVITFGGDGTVLRAGRLCGPLGIPLLAVNFGRLGFLIDVEPDEFFEKMADYLAGRFRVEQRIMLEARILPASGQPEAEIGEQYHRTFLGLNDVVISRGASPRVISIRTTLDDDLFTSYIADGAIICTPTGSTAYSLALGGPILDPQITHLMLTPIAPHLGLGQSIVLPERCRVQFEVQADQTAVFSIDGQIEYPLKSGDAVQVRVADQRVSIVRLRPPTYFYQSLTERLMRRMLSGG